MKTRDRIIEENSIEAVLQENGVKLIGSGKEQKAKCPFHKDKTPSLCVNTKTQLWKCQAGCGGGSVIDLLAMFKGVRPIDIIKEYADKYKEGKPEPYRPTTARKLDRKPEPVEEEQPKQSPSDSKIVAIYDYKNMKGELVYQAVRLEPKSFRQRRINPEHDSLEPESISNPHWLWNMEGVERVIYNLPKVMKSQSVWVVEGEKDADTLGKLGIVATCNVGGAGKWLEAYGDYLKGKEVVLCGDADEPGRKHMEDVLRSIEGKVTSARIIGDLPDKCKDISDYLAKFKDSAAQIAAIEKLFNDANLLDKGLDIGILSMEECEAEYIRSLEYSATRSLDLGCWLPSLSAAVRPLVGGEVLAFLGGTGVGKTAIAQNLSHCSAPLKTLLCEQELPSGLTFERYAAIETGTPAVGIYHSYKEKKFGESNNWRKSGRLKHIFIYPKTKVTIEKLREIIIKSELKIGERPALVIVDYIQLMGGASDRRERVATNAEGLKSLAKELNVIICLISQIKRKPKGESPEVDLEDAKEAGEIENSSGVVIGAWRDPDDPKIIVMKVLKNTKGTVGKQIACDFEGRTMRITERTKILPYRDDEPKKIPSSAPSSDED